MIGTTSSEEKAALVREAGADEVIGYEGFAERAREITDGEGVVAVYDGVGRATFLEGLKASSPTGRMIKTGAASGQSDPLDIESLARAGSLYVQRPTVQTYTRTPDLLRDRPAGCSNWSGAASSTSGSAGGIHSIGRGRRTSISRRGRRRGSCC